MNKVSARKKNQPMKTSFHQEKSKAHAIKPLNIAGRLPEELRKNRPACHIIEIETDTDLN